MSGGTSLLLAIDTATAQAGIALFDGSVLGEISWQSGQNQTTELLPTLLWLLERVGRRVDDLAAVAVSLGPGSFNGLRVGLSTAKALAFAREIPCLGIGTLEASAFQFVTVERLIRPVYEAGRGEVATALYRVEGGWPRELEAPRLVTVSALGDQIDRPTLVCGDVRREWAQLLKERSRGNASFGPVAATPRRAAYLAELGWRRWQGGERGDVVSLQPIYLRRPAITLPKA